MLCQETAGKARQAGVVGHLQVLTGEKVSGSSFDSQLTQHPEIILPANRGDEARHSSAPNVLAQNILQRDAARISLILKDLASRLSHRVQLTTDGHRPYLKAVEEAFGSEIDYSMLVKVYGSVPRGNALFSGKVRWLNERTR